MGQRNMYSTNRMINLEHDQQAHFHLHPDLCLPNYPQPSMNRVLPLAEPMSCFVPHHLSGSCENPIPFGMTQYNGVHHHPIAGNPGLSPAHTSNYYNPYVTPPGCNVFPPEINQGPQFVDGFGAAFKRKSAEGYHGNLQYCDSVAGPSFAGPLRPVGEESALAHNPNHLIHGSYSFQVLIPANAPWLDQRFSGNGGDGGAWAWGQAPAIPYMHGSGVNGGFTGMRNMVIEHYPETGANRISTNFQPHPPTVYPQGHPHSLHHLQQPVQGPFYPQVAGTSYRPPRNNDLHANVNTLQGGIEVGLRSVGPVPPGIGVRHPSHGRALLPGPIIRHHALPHLNLLPADEIAMLETGNTVDHHRDMRMDVDSMSYEELLALGEHIGNVTVGLSEKTISNHLKTRIHIAPTTSIEVEDRETDFCAICQNNYENQEKIGTLDCGHEYHVDCVKRWLIIKNICPVCKSSALTTKRKDSMREG